jgi:hypothetical protein
MLTVNTTRVSISSTAAALACVSAPRKSRSGFFFAALLRVLATMHV